VIAADGAGSGIRKLLGIDREDYGFNEKWLVVDARKKRDLQFAFDCGQICDPRRPVTILPLGKRHRRWEWALLPGESAADLEKPEAAWRLLGEQGVTPDDVEIIRQLVYTFEARHATRWREGRVFLAGDAAHTMPPFMGQGMCSGLRDAKNLIWKLHLVLLGVAGEELLDTYEPERSPHTKDWTIISIEAGKIPCTLDPEEARQRDERFKAGWLPPMPDFPKLVNGVLSRTGDGTPAGAAGTLGLQARIRKEGRVELFDEFYPTTAFSVISIAGDPRGVLRPDQIVALNRMGVHLVELGPQAGVEDLNGAYRDYMAEIGASVVVNRPDLYVFGACADLAQLPDLIDDLLAQLHYTGEVGIAHQEKARAVV